MSTIWLILLLLYLANMSEAVSRSSVSSASVSESSKGSEKSIENIKSPPLRKKSKTKTKRISAERKETIRMQNRLAQRKFRELNPERVKMQIKKYRERLRNDPKKYELKRIKVQKSNREYYQRRKQLKEFERANQEKDRQGDVSKGKRKGSIVEEEDTPKCTRVLHYGRPPMSSAFKQPELKLTSGQDKPRSNQDEEVTSTKPKLIVRFKLPKKESPKDNTDRESAV